MPRDSRHPERHWQAWLGHWCHVPPSEFGDLTCEQLLDCYDFANESAGG